MIAALCLLAIFGSSQGLDSAELSRTEIETSIDRTIKEVERKIQEDPSLPRLARDQILDVLFHVVARDAERDEADRVPEETRSAYRKALMVVLPYSAKENSEDTLKKLFSKPPLVQVIQNNSSNQVGKEELLDSWKTPGQNQDNSVGSQTDHPSYPVYKAAVERLRESLQNHKETYSEVVDSSLEKVAENQRGRNREPEKFSFDLRSLEDTSTSDQLDENVQDNVPESSKLEIVYSTGGTTESTLKSTAEKNKRPIDLATWKQMVSNNDARSKLKHERPSPVYVAPMILTTATTSSAKPKYGSTYTIASGGFLNASTTSSPISDEVEGILTSIGIRSENALKSGEKGYLRVSDISPNGVSGLVASGGTSSSLGSQNTFGDFPSDFRKGMDNLTPEVQQLFQKFGLQAAEKWREASTTWRPPTVKVSQNSYTNFKPLPTAPVNNKDMRDFLAKFGLGGEIRGQKSIDSKRSKDGPSPLADAVPATMKRILENIGLIARTKAEPTAKSVDHFASTERSPEVSATSKLHVFKPHEASLSDEEQKSKIHELLDTVRLVQEGKVEATEVQKLADRILSSSKSLSGGPDPLSLEEILRNYRDGLRKEVKRQQEDLTTQQPEKNQQQDQEGEQDQQDQRDQQSDGTGTEDEPTLTSTAATETTSANTTETSSPSSRNLEATSTASTAAEETTKANAEVVEETSSMSVLQDAPSTTSSPFNLAGLEESFGGSTRAPDPVLPTPRRSGLYFLVDWNTFLEVGEEGKDKVNLRFQPKVGDRSRFISVTVP
ncbi:uncharacterized protein LOC105696696 [Orussus abietinus]|uniref:uncharacterized protein LOC105696696 n=1 Tax=Orussus abietinus TaxID=222816 RepID=UPI0006267C65|nr:uncharacterized protein LOC105696696 [Orussus abietinus]